MKILAIANKKKELHNYVLNTFFFYLFMEIIFYLFM